MRKSKRLSRIPAVISRWRILAAIPALVCAACAASAADSSDSLLNLLVKKGVITEDEAKDLKTEANANATNILANAPGESKWQISDAIKNVELFGDVRFRYEDRGVVDPEGGKITLQRLRYALRLGLRGDAADDFYYGLRLDTGANPRSPWVNFGSSANGSSPYQGPFGKSTSTIGIGQIYIGWRPTDWLDVTVGKMANPLYTTSMVWDSDITPEGLAEHLKYTVGDADFFANFGQFLYQDTNPTRATSGYYNTLYTGSSLAFMLAWQAGFEYHFTTNISAKVGATLYNYTGRGIDTTFGSPGGSPDFSGIYVGQGATTGPQGQPISSSGFGTGEGPYDGFIANQTGINDLLIVEVPFEVNFRFDPINVRLFGDYAQNLQGTQRAQDAYAAAQQEESVNPEAGMGFDIALIPPGQTHEDKAYQFGLAVGNRDSLGLVYNTTSRKYGWEARGYFQHIEQFALDPNLIDSDFFEGRENMQGFYAAFAYGFTDNIIGTFRYGYASRINKNLGTGGSNQDIPQMNPIQQYSLFQLDLSCRF